MNPTPPPSAEPGTFDGRGVPCRLKHGLILDWWTHLPVGGHFVFINDHDPVPLYHQLQACFPGAFRWEYLVDLPDEVRIRITRLQATAPASLGPPPRCAAPVPLSAS